MRAGFDVLNAMIAHLNLSSFILASAPVSMVLIDGYGDGGGGNYMLAIAYLCGSS